MTKKWIITDEHDGNIWFEVEGDYFEDAAYNALAQLGWRVSLKNIGKEDEDAEENTDTVIDGYKTQYARMRNIAGSAIDLVDAYAGHDSPATDMLSEEFDATNAAFEALEQFKDACEDQIEDSYL